MGPVAGASSSGFQGMLDSVIFLRGACVSKSVGWRC